MSDDLSETIRLDDSEDLGESVCLNPGIRDDLSESILLDRDNSDYLGESNRFSGNDNLGESVHFREHDSGNLGESIEIVYECDDPPESTSLNQYDNTNPSESTSLDRYFSDLDYYRKTPIRSGITFTTSAIGLVELGNVVYNKLCEISPRFAKSVSSSMFMYYVSQLHYMRLCVVEWEVTKPIVEDLPTMNNIIQSNKWIVPQLLADYFKHIGSFRDTAGINAQHREIVFPSAKDIEGINGFFGRVDSNTHAHYENRISPGVAAKRIVEDLIYTLHPYGRVQEGCWNLPRILTPAERNCGGPTGNLLGWNYASILTPEQVCILKDCGISISKGKNTFSHCTRFCHNNQLMNHISSQLNELRGKVKCEEGLNTITKGSVAQHDFQLVGSHVGIHRTYVYGDLSTYNCGFLPLHMFQELHANAFRLRIVKRKMVQTDGISVNPWCCYDFKRYQEVPESWCKTSNLYFLLGKLKVWDVGWYKNKPTDLRHLLNGLMVKTLIQ